MSVGDRYLHLLVTPLWHKECESLTDGEREFQSRNIYRLSRTNLTIVNRTEVGVLSQPCPKEHYGKDWEYIQLTRNASPIFEERDGGYHEICFPVCILAFSCISTSDSYIFDTDTSRFGL